MMNPLRFVPLTLCGVLALAGCGNPLETGRPSGAVTLTVNLSHFSRSAEQAEYDYTVTLDGPSGETRSITAPKGAVSIQIQVTTGRWKIQVEAFLNGKRKYVGSATADVVPGGANRVQITMGEGGVSITYHNITAENLKNQASGVDNGANPPVYSSGEALTLANPARTDGAEFKGWYDNAQFTGNPVTVIPKGSVGDKEFWAKWTFPVRFYGLNGALNRAVQVVEGAPVSADDCPVITLPGWDGSGPADIPCDAWYTTAYNDGVVPGEKWVFGAGTTAGTTGNAVTGVTSLYPRWEAWDAEDFGSANPVLSGIYVVRNAQEWAALSAVNMDGGTGTVAGTGTVVGMGTGSSSGSSELSQAIFEMISEGNSIVYVTGTFNAPYGCVLKGNRVSIRGNGSIGAAPSATTPVENLGNLLVILGEESPGGIKQTVTLRGPAFTGDPGNRAAESAAPVWVSGGVCFLRSGTIRDNMAGFMAGGGILIERGGHVTMMGGTITGNTARAGQDARRGNGGGVLVYEGFFTIRGGTISENTADRNGGGVYVQDGELRIDAPASPENIHHNSAGGTTGGNVAFGSGGMYRLNGEEQAAVGW